MDAVDNDLFDHDFSQYPAYPGAKGASETGHQAAAAMASSTNRLQRLVLAAVTAAGPLGLTVVEAAERTCIDRFSIQPRFSELRAQRSIADSGLRRFNPSGRRAVVWVIPEHLPPLPEGGAA